MSDFTDEIARQPRGDFNGAERQGLRLMLEHWLDRRRFGRAILKYVGYAGGAVALAVGVLNVIRFVKGG